MSFINDYRRAKANGSKMRPLWQIAIGIPLYLIYLPANKFVKWMDNR